MAKEKMTEDLAVKILSGDFSHPRFAEAKKWMMDKFPGHPVLKELEKREKAFRKENNLESNDAALYTANAESLQKAETSRASDDESSTMFDKIVDAVSMHEYDKDDSGKGVIDTTFTPERKREYLAQLRAAKALEADMILLGSEQYNKASEKEKAEMRSEMVDAKFYEGVLQLLVASHVKKPEGKELEVGSKEHATWVKKESDKMEKRLNAAISSEGKKEKLNLDADLVLLSIENTANKVQAFTNQLKEKAKEFKDDARKKISSIAVRFLTRKDKVEKDTDKASRGRYSKIKAVATVIRDKASDEIWRYGYTAATSVGFAIGTKAIIALGAASAPWLIGVGVGYGALHAAGAWVLPVLAEKRKLERLAKEDGKKIKVSWKEARANLLVKKEGEKLSDYERSARLNTLLGLVGGAVIGGVLCKLQIAQATAEAARTGVEIAKEVAETSEKGVDVTKAVKIAGISLRAGTPAAANLADAGITYCQNPNDPSTRFKAGQKALSGVFAGLAAGGTILLSSLDWSKVGGWFKDVAESVKDVFGHGGHGTTVAETVANTTQEAASNIAPDAAPYVQAGYPYGQGSLDTLTTSKLAPGDGVRLYTQDVAQDSLDVSNVTDSAAGVEGVAGGAAATQFEPFPVKWNKELAGSIDKPHWDLAMSRINNGQIADIDPNGLDKIWVNMDDEFMSHFPEGTKKAEVFYDYVELMRNGRRHIDILGGEKYSFTDMYGEKQVGFYYNTPAGKVKIEDEGIIAYAKEMIAKDRIPEIARPHGENFLAAQLMKLDIEGMDGDKMQAVIDIAMGTYDKPQVMDSVAKIHEMFPEMNKGQLTKLAKIVDYNRAYNENGEALEALTKAINCHDQSGLNEQTTEVLSRRAEILSKSTGDARADSIEAGNCNSTMLHSRAKPVVVTQTVEETTEVVKKTKETMLTTTQEIKGQVEHTSEAKLATRAAAPAPKTPSGREGFSQFESTLQSDDPNATTITDEQAAEAIKDQQRLQGQKVQKGNDGY